MGRVAAVFGGLVGVLLVPLALAAPTAWVLVPAHLLFSVLVTIATTGEGFAGRPERARLWGLAYLVASVAMVAALELGAGVRSSRYWIGPWVLVLLWAWVPPVAAGLAGWMGEARERALGRRAVRSRRRVRAERPTTWPDVDESPAAEE